MLFMFEGLLLSCQEAEEETLQRMLKMELKWKKFNGF